jgi:hypothetical protein
MQKIFFRFLADICEVDPHLVGLMGFSIPDLSNYIAIMGFAKFENHAKMKTAFIRNSFKCNCENASQADIQILVIRNESNLEWDLHSSCYKVLSASNYLAPIQPCLIASSFAAVACLHCLVDPRLSC